MTWCIAGTRAFNQLLVYKRVLRLLQQWAFYNRRFLSTHSIHPFYPPFCPPYCPPPSAHPHLPTPSAHLHRPTPFCPPPSAHQILHAPRSTLSRSSSLIQPRRLLSNSNDQTEHLPPPSSQAPNFSRVTQIILYLENSPSLTPVSSFRHMFLFKFATFSQFRMSPFSWKMFNSGLDGKTSLNLSQLVRKKISICRKMRNKIQFISIQTQWNI